MASKRGTPDEVKRGREALRAFVRDLPRGKLADEERAVFAAHRAAHRECVRLADAAGEGENHG